MIVYHEGYLGVSPSLLFRVRGSVVPKAMVWALPCMLVAMGLFVYWGEVDDTTSSSVGQAWTGYSFILGFLIVFRMQISYTRYWEACTMTNEMRGEWLDAFCSLCSFCTRDETKHDQIYRFKGLLMRLLSLLHQGAIEKLCLMDVQDVPIIDPTGLEPEYLEFVMHHPDKMEILMTWIEQSIVDAAQDGIVTVAPPILSRAFHELSRGMVRFVEVRKIRTYSLPFPVVQMIQYLMIFHAVVTPIIASLIMYNWRWAGMLAFSSVFSLWCINYIAMEVEQPFGDHWNNLPVIQMQLDFNKSLLMSTNRFMWRPPNFEIQASGRKFSKGAEIIHMTDATQALSEGVFEGKYRQSMMQKQINMDDELDGDECANRSVFNSEEGKEDIGVADETAVCTNQDMLVDPGWRRRSL